MGTQGLEDEVAELGFGSAQVDQSGCRQLARLARAMLRAGIGLLGALSVYVQREALHQPPFT